MAQVMVWLPSAILNNQKSIELAVGHASLLAKGAGEPAYVSWWPNGSAGLKEPATTGHYVNDYHNDIRLEGGLPHTVDLPQLDDGSISQWWKLVRGNGFSVPYRLEYLPKGDNYDMYDNNCSFVVYQAMKIGGAETIVKFPSHKVVTPFSIYVWAKMIQTKEEFSEVVSKMKDSVKSLF